MIEPKKDIWLIMMNGTVKTVLYTELNEFGRITKNVWANCVRPQKGITLVALVVTLVVLLILAGVTITMIFSNNGVIKKAQEAANKTNEAKENDLHGLQNLEDQMNDSLDTSSLTALIKTGANVTKNTEVVDKTGKKITIPEGYKVIADANEVDKGIVIEDELENQYVWVPVPDVTSMYETQSGEKIGKLYNFSIIGTTPIKYSSTGYREPDILTSTSTGDAITGNASQGIEQLKNTVGITGTDDKTVLANWGRQLQNEFNIMITSVEKYKGFYIGRYETGNLVQNTITAPVVKKGQTAIGDANWYYQYVNSKKLSGANNNVTTSMIWGSQYDRTLQWLVESGSKTDAELKDSRSWGNHSDSTGAAAIGKGSKQPTGTNEEWKANNIYDLAGNVYDWTIESSNTYCRVLRGGFYNGSGSDNSCSNRSVSNPYYNYSNFGSRSVLYIN